MSSHFIVISLVVKFCKGILHLHLIKDILAAVANGSTFCVIHIVAYSRSDAEFHTKILHDIKCHTGSETKCHTHDI